MRFLHTSDWHVGKTIRGHSRAGEHRAVLEEITAVAAERAVDLTVVAGDLFDTATPTAESERIVYHALLGLAEVAPVVVISGNHDNARRLDAVSRLLALGRVTMATQPRPPADGGVVSMVTADGTKVAAALVPFVSQRAIVRADELMSEPAFRNAQSYAERMSAVIGSLTAGFDADAVNLVVAHAFVAGGAVGGGERAAHLVDEYAIGAVDFPATVSYAALGHLHRPQAIAGRTALHYCGSPLQLDFGEERQTKQVNVVSAEPGLPAKVEPVLLRSGRPLLTLTGTVADLAGLADEMADAWIRVRVREAPRAGLADEVRAVLGDGVVDVRVDHESETTVRRTDRADGRTPGQLFAEYLAERSIDDQRLVRAFDALHDELSSPAGPDDDARPPAALTPSGTPATPAAAPEPAPAESERPEATSPSSGRPASPGVAPTPPPDPEADVPADGPAVDGSSDEIDLDAEPEPGPGSEQLSIGL